MILSGKTVEEISRRLAAAHSAGTKIEGYDLQSLDQIPEHVPEDMTVTVEAGVTLEALQKSLAKQQQWLPIDPPFPENATIGGIIACNASGPRRFGYGTIRDYLIGIKVVLADGKVVKSGGKVVKNVAGYDLQKLFVGSRGSLGVIVEAAFKLRPLPEAERILKANCSSLQEAGKVIAASLEAEITPVILDLHPGTDPPGPVSFVVVLGLAGTAEEVEWQLSKAHDLGFTDPADLAYERAFWNRNDASWRRLSVLPSRLVDAIGSLGNAPFVARAGNGVIYHRANLEGPKANLPIQLMRRVKDAYDPRHILPELPL